jgi:hypothetical protein
VGATLWERSRDSVSGVVHAVMTASHRVSRPRFPVGAASAVPALRPGLLLWIVCSDCRALRPASTKPDPGRRWTMEMGS